MLRDKRVWGVVLGLTLLVAVDAQASLVKDLRYGLGAAGFQQQLTKDVLQDGWVLQFNQNFANKHYDFGTSELTLLSGNMNGFFSIGNRGIPEVEFSINSTQIPYTFEYFDGPNKFTVDNGVFQIAADVKINQYGFYDIQLDVANRGTIIAEDGTAIPIDYNIGPINVHGQWLVDVVNATLGQAFGFVLPGGINDQIAKSLLAAGGLEDALKKLEQGVSQELGLDTAVPAGITVVVPEPVSLVFLMTGLVGLMIRRR